MRKSHAFTSYSYHLVKPMAKSTKRRGAGIEYMTIQLIYLCLTFRLSICGNCLSAKKK